MDRIFGAWLERQHVEGQALAQESDIFSVKRLDPQRFATDFRCRGLVKGADGRVREAGRFRVGVWFPDGYLVVEADPLDVLSWIAPVEVFHPNIRFPKCCIGPIAPGTRLVDIAYRVYEVISYQSVMPHELDALNLNACSWARHHQDRFPVDARPLKRRPPARRHAELEVIP